MSGTTLGEFLRTYWRDVLNVVGLTGTLISLWLTYWQSRKARTAAEAAAAASARAEAAGRDAFRRHSIVSAVRVLNESKLLVTAKSWDALTLRLSDLASHLAQIDDPGESFRTLYVESRTWEALFRQMASDRKTYSRVKWADFLGRLQTILDEHHGPFRAAEGTRS